jgi:glycosyltransferase involved in cell wall biosynthesis/tetratricopeptide (TPR) repeat protein
MIFRNNAESIARALDSALPIVDEGVFIDTGSNDGTPDIIRAKCEENGVECIIEKYEDPAGHPKWISDFQVPRELSRNLATGDVCIWMDTDDVFQEIDPTSGSVREAAFRLRAFIELAFFEGNDEKMSADALRVRYDFRHSPYGTPSLTQERTIAFRPNCFTWGDGSSPVHELLMPDRPIRMAGEPYKQEFWISHTGAHSDEGSAERNLWIVERWRDSGHKMTPTLYRTIGDSLGILGRRDEAVAALTEGLGISDNLEDSYQLTLRRAALNNDRGRTEEALDDFSRASRLRPGFSQPYLSQARILYEAGRDEAALALCAMSDALGTDDADGACFDPTSQRFGASVLRAKIYERAKEHEKALAEWENISRAWPEDIEVVEGAYRSRSELWKKGLHEAFMCLWGAMDGNEDARRMLALCAPPDIADMPIIAHYLRPERPEGHPVVAIWCGEGADTWGPHSLEKGVGGSEECVIHMSRKLTERGFYVEVYGNPQSEDIGIDRYGVCWQPVHAWRPGEQADVFIVWRSVEAVSLGRSCGKRFLWLHDLPNERWYSPSLLDSVDGIFCISEFQASHLRPRCDQKIIRTSNGIDADDMRDGENANNRFIYASSPDRGLEQLLGEWPKIRKAIPDAELEIFYGFNKHYDRNSIANPDMARAREVIERLIDQPGITNHGMVGQSFLHERFAAAGFWLYPSQWPETYCITAAKAQACGAIPITLQNPNTALPEVCGLYDLGPEGREDYPQDDPTWLDEWTARVIEVATGFSSTNLDTHRAEMKMWSRQNQDWDLVADQWDELFRPASIREAVSA